MIATYRTVFDLTAHPERIQPAYGFYAIFLLVGIGVVAFAIAARRFGWQKRKSMAIFAGLWMVFVCIMIPYDFRDVLAVRASVQHAEIGQVEGCLAYFRPGVPTGTKTTLGNEACSVAGTAFDYGAGEERPGYHLVEANGGVVHPDSKVRIFFVTSQAYDRKEIVRIDSVDHACPQARHVEPFAEL
ncbi:hypothetical protein [Novosphingobium rosa]|uniref:hypothetical protein n=1 Tax=Novosphingobium rosa TaxID=76978 RepID=UPI0008327003|nr:hypothetical protein [Novosphingobium rosa]